MEFIDNLTLKQKILLAEALLRAAVDDSYSLPDDKADSYEVFKATNLLRFDLYNAAEEVQAVYERLKQIKELKDGNKGSH